jgi:hypothetical protein
MLFPERDLANEFWLFLRDQAIDPRGADGCRPPCRALDLFEIDRQMVTAYLGDLIKDPSSAFPADENEEEPRLYRTLQEALLAFLIYWQQAGRRFPITYDIWVRTIVLIMADAQRSPGFLRLEARDLSQEGKAKEWAHTMVISDDWDCLRRETYEFVLAAFRDGRAS